jgi:transposase
MMLRRWSGRTARRKIPATLKLLFLEVFTQPKRVVAGYLDRWCRWAVRSRLPEMVRVAWTIREHWGGRAALVHVPHLNRVLEGINSLIQAAKARARGCRNVDNPITMAYLIAGQLRFNVSVFR